MTNNFAGYYQARLIQTTLPNNFSGASNTVNLIEDLPPALISLINQTDIFAIIGCKDQRGELVRITKQSYSQTNKSLIIIRGQSKFANGSLDNQSVIDLSSIPRDITLDFGVVYPAGLQQLVDQVNGLLGYDASILRGLLPPANQDNIGGVKVSYTSSNESSNFIPKVIPTNAPAHEHLYKAIFGVNSITYETGLVNETELVRVQTFGKFVDWLAENPNRLDTLITLINTLQADPAKLNNIIK